MWMVLYWTIWVSSHSSGYLYLLNFNLRWLYLNAYEITVRGMWGLYLPRVKWILKYCLVNKDQNKESVNKDIQGGKRLSQEDFRSWAWRLLSQRARHAGPSAFPVLLFFLLWHVLCCPSNIPFAGHLFTSQGLSPDSALSLWWLSTMGFSLFSCKMDQISAFMVLSSSNILGTFTEVAWFSEHGTRCVWCVIKMRKGSVASCLSL